MPSLSCSGATIVVSLALVLGLVVVLTAVWQLSAGLVGAPPSGPVPRPAPPPPSGAPAPRNASAPCTYTLHQLQTLPLPLPPAPATCTHTLLRVVAAPQPPRGSAIALLRTASDLPYIRRFFVALENSVAYAQQYGYDHYLYIAGEGRGYTARVQGLQEVLNRSAAAYVLYLDLDAIFEPRVFLDDHPLDVFTRSGKSLILLGEMALCSCHFLLKRSPWSRWFLREWQARCAIPTYCTQGRGQDQVAYAILIYETIVNESDHQELSTKMRQLQTTTCGRTNGYCISNGISRAMWGRYEDNRLLPSFRIPHIAILPCNGTAARPQLANPWALRSVPYTGYRPAYIKHHGSHVFASAVAPYAVTPRMAPPEHRAVAAAHAAAWGPARWPRAQDWKWQWHAKTRRRIPGPAGPAPAPQPPTEALGKAIFLGMALQNVTGARRGLQVGLQNGEFAFDTLAAWPNCTRYDIVRGSWEAPPPRRAPAPAATPAVAEPQGWQSPSALLEPWAHVYRVHEGPLAEYIAHVPNVSLDFVFFTAPQEGPEELRLLPSLWAQLRPGGYIGGFWWISCRDPPAPARAVCARRRKGRAPVTNVKDRVLQFATSVGRRVHWTLNDAVPSWYFVR